MSALRGRTPFCIRRARLLLMLLQPPNRPPTLNAIHLFTNRETREVKTRVWRGDKACLSSVYSLFNVSITVNK